MAKKFYAQKDALGYPIPGTLMSAAAVVPPGNIEIPAEDITTGALHPGKLRYFVRKDLKGNIIPNSLIISLKRPQGLVYEFRPVSGGPVVPATAVTFIVDALANDAFYVKFGATTGQTPTITVNFGDGTAPVTQTVTANQLLTFNHTYATAGTYTVWFDSSDPLVIQEFTADINN